MMNVLGVALTVLLFVWLAFQLFFSADRAKLWRHPALPLLAVFLAFAAFNCACIQVAGFFAVAQAILATVNIVLKSLSSVIPPAEEAEIQSIVGEVSSDMTLVENDITAFEANKTGVGLLATLQAGITTLQGSLSKLEAAAGIKNQVLLNWIAAIVSAIGAAITEVATVVIPQVPAALAASLQGDDTKLVSLGNQIKVITTTLRDAHNAAADKLLDPATAKLVKTRVNHSAEPHIGSIRV